MNLYEINQKIIDLINSGDENGEIDSKAFDELQITKEEKQLNICKFIKKLEADDDVFEKEIERIKKLQERSKKKKEWLKQYLQSSMEFEGVSELDFTVFKAKIRKNPPRLVIQDEAQIPTKFKVEKVSISIDKDGIKQAIKEGEAVQGCILEQTERLEIK